MIYGIYKTIKNTIISVFSFLLNFPAWCKNKYQSFSSFLAESKSKLSDLAGTNIELGIYHLMQENIGDSILRFKLVTKFLSIDNPEANYWLGWCYFLKRMPEKAWQHLQNSGSIDQIGFKNFLQNYSSCQEIPDQIWAQIRNLSALSYTDNFINEEMHLPYTFVQTLITKLDNIPNEYNILELGSNLGLLGHEIRKRLPDSFTLIGTEDSTRMIEITDELNKNIYNELIPISVAKFLTEANLKFDIIVSCLGFTFASNLTKYFEQIYDILAPNGYFAFALPTNSSTSFSLRKRCFVYATEDITRFIVNSKFNLLVKKDLLLDKNNNYAIFICTK